MNASPDGTDAPHSTVVVLGAGRQALETCGYLQRQGLHVAALIEEHAPDYPRDPDLFPAPIFTLASLPDAMGSLPVVTAVGDSDLRRALVDRFPGATFASVVADGAWISPTATLGADVTVGPLAIVNARAVIGDHVLVNSGAIVSHNVQLGDYATVGPGARIGGDTAVGASTTIGIGATIIDHLRIGSHVVVAAGAVVVSDVADGTTVMGVPARPVHR